MTATALFNAATVVYGASAYLYVAGWLTREHRAQRWAPRLLGAAVALYWASTALRWNAFGFPFLTIREVLSVYAWALALLYLLLEIRSGYSVIGVLVTPVGSLMILASSLLPGAQQPLLPLLQSPWLMAHTGVLLAAYAAFTVAFAAALAYLLQDWSLRRRRLAWRLPPLPMMDLLSRWLVGIGLVLMIAAIFTGSAWARQAWGKPWVWQPKQVLAVLTVAIFSAYLFVRHISRWSVRQASWLVVVGFAAILATFMGADLLAPSGLHSFLWR